MATLPDDERDLLRVLTCGSVDDGKSTLIGRLLYDSHALMSDQLETLARESHAAGRAEGVLDFSLLLDGLAAEREQGITIDVAYRYVSTASRHFIIADTPGHEQYTRNMVTGASTADLAILLVDARKGLLTQTHRHAFLVTLMGIRRVVLAVNKMDLVSWDEARFTEITEAFLAFARQLGIEAVQAIPLSARDGANVAAPTDASPWYGGPTLVEHLEAVPLDTSRRRAAPFRMPVQWVNRPDQAFRGFAGEIVSGQIAPGAAVRILPSGRTTSIARIVTQGGDLESAGAGQSVTLTLADEVDCARGDIIAAAGDPPESADQFAVDLVWMAETALLPGRSYWMKLGTRTVLAQVTEIKHRVHVDTLEHLAAKTLELNEIGACNLSLDRPVAFEPYDVNPGLGGFILIDRVTNATVGAGMIRFALRRAQNIHWQAIDVTKVSRAAAKGQAPRVLWFTGLSGAGKSTIANLLEKRLQGEGRHTFLLDGDNVRHGLNRDLGFTDADRVENIRRVVEVAKLMTEAGLIVLVSFISPFRAERQLGRERMEPGEFVEIFIDVPLAEAERRDVKGLYKKARAGQLKNFTGIDSPYEPPEQAEIIIDTTRSTPTQAVDQIMAWLAVNMGFEI